MIERIYNLGLTDFVKLIEDNGYEFQDERPGVFVYSLEGEDIFFGEKTGAIAVSASEHGHDQLRKWMENLPQQSGGEVRG